MGCKAKLEVSLGIKEPHLEVLDLVFALAKGHFWFKSVEFLVTGIKVRYHVLHKLQLVLLAYIYYPYSIFYSFCCRSLNLKMPSENCIVGM